MCPEGGRGGKVGGERVRQGEQRGREEKGRRGWC